MMPALSPTAAQAHPQARWQRAGSAALSDAELLSLLIRTGHDGRSALDIAETLLEKTRGLPGLVHARTELQTTPGLGQTQIAAIHAALEVARRLARSQVPDRRPFDRPQAVAHYLQLRYGSPDHEIMGALYLDVRQRLLHEAELFRGTLCRSVVEPRSILKEAILRSAASLILWHTHPSGDPTPSREDKLFTKRLDEAAEIIGVKLVDHLILGGGDWVSLQQQGGW